MGAQKVTAGNGQLQILGDDLPLFRSKPIVSLLSFQPLLCENHFYGKYLLPSFDLTSQEGQQWEQTGLVSQHKAHPLSLLQRKVLGTQHTLPTTHHLFCEFLWLPEPHA